MKYTRASLKWSGGKYRVLPHLIAALPPRRYLVEPFVGSGVVFLNAEFDGYFINDINPDLMGFYQVVRDRLPDLVDCARTLFHPRFNNASAYYDLREAFNARIGDGVEHAAWFLYLNRHGYNGLCRYNRKGRFNVPFGSYKNPYFPDKEMRALQAKLQRAVLSCQDYCSFLANWGASFEESTVYCDPPYAPLCPEKSYFSQYAPQPFALSEHSRLIAVVRRCAQKGAHVLVSNHDTPWIRSLYQGGRFSSISVRRSISCRQRGYVPEVLAAFDNSLLPGYYEANRVAI